MTVLSRFYRNSDEMKQYYISTDGVKQQGPFDEETLKANYAQGIYPAMTMVWTEGMSEWKPIGAIFTDVPSAPVLLSTDCSYSNPFSAIVNMFKHYADVKGRATRKEYWMSALGYILFFILFQTSAIMIGSTLLVGLCLLFQLASIVPMISLQVRRLHDIGKSGWFILIGATPMIGGIILIVFYCIDSQRGTNGYGPSEKYPD